MSVEVIEYLADGYNFYTEVLRNAGVRYIPIEINKDAPLCDVTGEEAVARVRRRLLQDMLSMQKRLGLRRGGE